MNEEAPELPLGEAIGDYRVKRLLGRGGFGEVYLAENVHTAVEVAAKVFRPSEANVRLATSSREEGLQVLRERFLHDARTLQGLHYVQAVVDVGHVGVLGTGEPYYVMPYYPESLADRIGKDVFVAGAQAELEEAERPRALAYDEGMRILGQVLEGLAAAHGSGIVHRDVKPSNVLLDGNGNACVADFGIAKVPDSGLTESGMGLGSRLYMAPEQRESARQVDARADVYSFGRLAYRVLTGRLPDDRYEDPMTHAPRMGPALNGLIVLCLQRDLSKRPASAAAVREQWRACAPAEGVASVEETAHGPMATPTISGQVPLHTEIAEALLSRGDVAHVRGDLETLAHAAGLDQGELDGLIEQVRLEHSRSVDAVQALREAVDHELSRSEGEISERGRELLLKAARAGNLEERLDDIVAWRRETYRLQRQSNAEADNTRPRDASATRLKRLDWLAATTAIGASIALYFVGTQWPQRPAPPTAAAAYGTLTLELSPADAEVTLPDVEGGYIPGMRLREGRYQVKASREGYTPVTREVAVRAGAETRKRIELSRDEDRLRGCGWCPELVEIPAGQFRMGDLAGAGQEDEKPVRRVRVPRFALARHETTVGQFRRFAMATGYRTDAEQDGAKGCRTLENATRNKLDWTPGRSWRNLEYTLAEDQPVACMSWNDARAYIGWLNEETGGGWRLPSEAEWEYAARAGSETRYHFGDDATRLCEYGNVADTTKLPNGNVWTNKAECADGAVYPTRVGSYLPNALGLHDMHGNVREWTEDCWNGSYQGAPTDGSAWEGGDCSRRVLRGGSWIYNPSVLRAANREWGTTGVRTGYIGFRVARTLAP